MRKFFLVGSGSDGLRDAAVCSAILDLVPRDKATNEVITVLYVGTATYDKEANKNVQTMQFAAQGCRVLELKISSSQNRTKDEFHSEMSSMCDAADIIIVSGGNTLFAVDCWKAVGADVLFKRAMDRGCVMAGGSAGAICWFDSGHSDSYDPATFKDYFLGESIFQSANAPSLDWKYIRVPGLGFLSGLCCPHFDKRQSNGILRAVDFDAMLLRHSGEIGIGIDHFCALVIDGDEFSVFPIPNQVGSVLEDGTFGPGRGRPGVWRKEVCNGAIITTLVPPKGSLSDLLRSATTIEIDPAIYDCRAHNPIYSDLTAASRPKPPVNVGEMAASLGELWSPKVVAEMDDYYVKVAKVHGKFTWHAHEHEDELFHILKGRLVIELESGPVELNAGDVFVVPKGMKHNPIAVEECHVMLVEKKSTLHTGDVVNEKTRSIADQIRNG